jgi:hypothetical protein
MVQAHSNKYLSPLARGSSLLYRFLAAFLTLAITVQVFLAGLGILVNPRYFAWHGNFAHVIESIPLLLFIFVGFLKVYKHRILSQDEVVLSSPREARAHS